MSHGSTRFTLKLKMATTYKPPLALPRRWQQGYSVFLAGSIEMGAAPDWQAEIERNLAHLDIDIYNPRRDNWDPTWVQSADNPQFREQVEWELDALAQANLVVMYLAPGTMSPISLLELGIYAANGGNKLIVCCPEGFHRKGNVDIVCERYGVEQVDSLEELEEVITYKWVEGICLSTTGMSEFHEPTDDFDNGSNNPIINSHFK
jgi:hypothetical protein